MPQMFVFFCVWAVTIFGFYTMLIGSFTSQCSYCNQNIETKNSSLLPKRKNVQCFFCLKMNVTIIPNTSGLKRKQSRKIVTLQKVILERKCK